MSSKQPLSIPSILAIAALLLVQLVISQSFTLAGGALLCCSVFSFGIIGHVLLSATALPRQVLPITLAALSVFLGALLASLLLFVSPSGLVITIVASVTAVLLCLLNRKKMQLQLSVTLPDLVTLGCALLAGVLLSAGDNNIQFLKEQPSFDGRVGDMYYFTSVVATIRNGSIYSAVYEQGSPLNYQVLGFFIPAMLANVANISSHQALWGVGQPFYKLLTLLLTYELCYFFVREKVTRTNYVFVLASMLLPILLAPLHPLYVLKGEVKNFIFNGMSYLLPAGTVTYPFAIVLLLFCLLLFLGTDWADRKQIVGKLLFAVGLAVMVIGKIPIFFSFFIFMATVILIRLFTGRNKLLDFLPYMVVSLVITYLVHKSCMGQEAGGHSYFKYGYLAGLFGGWYGKSSEGLANNVLILGIIAGTYLLWLGARLIGLLTLLRAKVTALNEFFWGALVALLATTVLASFLRIEMVDEAGKLLEDDTFNVEQFIRSAFYVATVVASVGVAYFLFSGAGKRKWVMAGKVVVACWCALAAISLLHPSKFAAKHTKKSEWYSSNLQALKTGRFNDGMIVVYPYAHYGIMLASSDYGRYWSAMGRSSEAENGSIKNKYRWVAYQDFLDHPQDSSFNFLTKESVKYIIATPADAEKLAATCTLFPGRMRKADGTQWIYQIN